MNTQKQSRKLTIKDIALIGIMVATIEVVKQALAFLPNIEAVSLLILLYTLTFGSKIFFAIPVFILIEGCLYGFGIWWINYLYIWPLLAIIVFLFRKKTSAFFFSVLSGVYGLFFGALCALAYLFIGGPAMAFSYWIAGIPYDILHCIGNFCICLALFRPLRYILIKAKEMFT